MAEQDKFDHSTVPHIDRRKTHTDRRIIQRDRRSTHTDRRAVQSDLPEEMDHRVRVDRRVIQRDRRSTHTDRRVIHVENDASASDQDD